MRKCLCVLFVLSCCLGAAVTRAQQFPEGFIDTEVLNGLSDPATLAFAPDGRLFVGERISGRLLIAKRSGDSWTLEAVPYFTFDVPVNADGTPARHRSSGLRDIAFDPDFASNGWIYAFYMQNNPRHNRVVRVKAVSGDPDLGDPASRETLIDLPFNAAGSSGSHNGGGLEFGVDGMLYITTGDGWTGGDPVQALDTFTGKVLRLQPDGAIPTDNPFYGTLSGDYRAIYAWGLRNPFSISYDPGTTNLFVNDAVGVEKANIYLLSAGDNYGHQGGANVVPPWANASSAGVLITGGAWYPTAPSFAQPFPESMFGSYFVALWGSNGSTNDGVIGRLRSFADPTAESFGTLVHDGSAKPILTRLDPIEGDLFYALTTYETETGSVHRVRFTGEDLAATPAFSPQAGAFEDPVDVTVASTTFLAEVRYTDDGSDPIATSSLVTGPITVNTTTTLKARAFAPPLAPSFVAEATYVIGPIENLPPVAIAGADQLVEVGQLVTLNGSASYDPDGDDEELDEAWLQIAGEPVPFAGDDFVSFFTPSQVGDYEFELTVSDGEDTVASTTTVTAVTCVDDVLDSLVARWSLNEGAGTIALDSSAGARIGTVVGATWTTETQSGSGSALVFDGQDDRLDLGSFDLGGSALTMSLWFRADDFDQMDGRLLTKATAEAEQSHLWMLSTIQQSAEHRLRVRIRTEALTKTLIAGSGALVPGQWHHAAATYDGSALTLYLDGAQVGSMPVSGSVETGPLVPVAVGDQPQGNRPFDGSIDGIRIYGRALDVSEIESLAGIGASRCVGLFSDGFESGDTAAWLDQ